MSRFSKPLYPGFFGLAGDLGHPKKYHDRQRHKPRLDLHDRWQ